MKIIYTVAVVAAALLSACQPKSPPAAAAASASAAAASADAPRAAYAPMAGRRPTVPELTALGRAMFNEPALSASGKLACASCHSPDNAYSPNNNLAAQLGGADGKTEGTRAAPSLRYIQNAPAFSEHYHDDDGDDSVDAGPTGGHNWDGRAQSAHEQALGPLLSAHEMGNKDEAAVLANLRASPLAAQFRKVYGEDIFERPNAAMQGALMALEVFQESPTDFYPYNSKYDAFLRKQTTLSAQELRGLRLFNDETKGNCASCHISQISPGGVFPQFTDYGLINIGVPRNRKLLANADPQYYDLGLCGPDRTDLKDHKEYCGAFKTPSLRNVALRKAYFHNGSFTSLTEVVRFYATRDTAPMKWYKQRKFDDQPAGLDANVNVEAPFGGKPGDKPLLNESEIADIVAFLKTLTDGYSGVRSPNSTRAQQ
ncbi:c-type cytochrome [Pseudoduganella sp. FT25W]|uniref:C-type cytochrome n=1 Tax=Duganella alba TaxID=2666081 RepID=A0A6L5QQC4_9BURK|nr:cytochrome-c peroxidase [Duganella alba]MRX11512.1 c-type cytochrome [Duganella alba]MRX19601.1 c-type cytochrome [Duganella alba]